MESVAGPHARTPSRGRARRVTACGLGLLFGVALVSACTASPNQKSDPKVTPQIASEVTDWLFTSTVAQADGSVVFANTIDKFRDDRFRTCMSSFGFGAKAQQFALSNDPILGGGIPTAKGYIASPEIWEGLADLGAIRRTGMLAPIYIGSKLADSAAGMPTAQRAAIVAKSRDCWDQVNRLYAPMEGGPIAALERLWIAAVNRFQENLAMLSANQAFGTCVTTHGAPENVSGSLSSFANWLRQTVDGRLYSGKASLTPSMHVRQLDAHWSDVFAECAVPVVRVAEHLLPPLRRSFLQDHFQQISAAESRVALTIAQLE